MREGERQKTAKKETGRERKGKGGGKRLMPPPFRKQYHQSTGCQWVAQYIPLPPGEASLEHHLWVVLSFKLHLSLLSFSDASNKSVKTLSTHCLVPIMLPFSWGPYFGCMNGLTYRACGCLCDIKRACMCLLVHSGPQVTCCFWLTNSMRKPHALQSCSSGS